MKKLIFLSLMITIFTFPVFSQTVKISKLPSGINTWTDETSEKILENPIIKKRLKVLLGKTNYAAFMESFETQTPIIKNGNVLFTSGCLVHACSKLESAVAINLTNNSIHAAIFNSEKKTKYFNERGSKTPKAITDWANRLKDLNQN